MHSIGPFEVYARHTRLHLHKAHLGNLTKNCPASMLPRFHGITQELGHIPTATARAAADGLLSKLLVSPVIAPIVVPNIIPGIGFRA